MCAQVRRFAAALLTFVFLGSVLVAADVPSVADTEWALQGTGKLSHSPASGGRLPKRALGIGFLLSFTGDGSFSMLNTNDEVFLSGTWEQRGKKVLLEVTSVNFPADASAGVLGGIPDFGSNDEIELIKWKLTCKVKSKNGEDLMFFQYKLVYSLNGGEAAVHKGKFKGSGSQSNEGGGASNSATVAWNPPKKNEDLSKVDDLASFKVYYGKVGVTPESVDVSDPATREHTLQGLDSGAVYGFYVTAVDSSGNESEASPVVYKSFP